MTPRRPLVSTRFAAALAAAAALGFAAPVNAQAQPQPAAPSPPGTPAPAESPTEPEETPQPVSCAVRAPACFAECPHGAVRTAKGLCVRATPPQPSGHHGAITIQELNESAPPAVARDGTPLALVPACCLIPLKVTAVGVKNHGPHAERSPIAADVRINGQLVGKTPFLDGLPSGDYFVEVLDEDGIAKGALLALRAGKGKALSAEVDATLTDAEAAAREAWRRERYDRFVAERRARMAQDHARQRADFEAEHRRWETETKPLRDERTLKQTAGIVALSGGAAFLVAGTLLEISANGKNDDAQEAAARWRQSADAGDRERWANRARDAEDTRDLHHALGLTALGVGAAGAIAGTVLLLSTPSIPPEPTWDPGIASRPSVQVHGFWLPTAAGAGARVVF